MCANDNQILLIFSYEQKIICCVLRDEHYNTVPLVLQLVWLQAITFVIHPDAAWIHTELFHHHVADSFGTALAQFQIVGRITSLYVGITCYDQVDFRMVFQILGSFCHILFLDIGNIVLVDNE